jgi:hypothetical protein
MMSEVAVGVGDAIQETMNICDYVADHTVQNSVIRVIATSCSNFVYKRAQ